MLTKPQSDRNRGRWLRLRAMRGLTLLPMLCLSAAAWAQDDDEKPVPIDPKTAAAENRTLGIIALVVILFVGWYFLRRWQITHRSSGGSSNDRFRD